VWCQRLLRQTKRGRRSIEWPTTLCLLKQGAKGAAAAVAARFGGKTETYLESKRPQKRMKAQKQQRNSNKEEKEQNQTSNKTEGPNLKARDNFWRRNAPAVVQEYAGGTLRPICSSSEPEQVTFLAPMCVDCALLLRAI
jgi:hypothetical protein